MPKFTFVCDHSVDLDTHVVSHTFKAEELYDVIANFEQFLKGAGYSFDGILDICTPIDETMLTVGTPQHSFHFYDTERNK